MIASTFFIALISFLAGFVPAGIGCTELAGSVPLARTQIKAIFQSFVGRGSEKRQGVCRIFVQFA
jgi:hypothetical protein